MNPETYRLLIIGGSDAGISAALRIKEIDPKAQVTVMAADAYPNFSICGLPFYLSGEVKDWRTLAHRTVEEIKKHGIDLLLDHKARAIDPRARQVQVRSSDGNNHRIAYAKLLIATGAESARPPIEGLENPGVFFLRWMDDSFSIKRFMDQESPRRAVVIGGGYIGLEMADALTHKRMAVTLLEFAPEVLTTLDPELGALIRVELQSKGVRVIAGQIEAAEAGFDPLTVTLTSWDHKVYYPAARQLHVRLTGERSTGRLLGAQLVGHRESEVSKRVDIVAAALYHGMAVKELYDLDLSYTPPLSSPWDPVQMAAIQWLKDKEEKGRAGPHGSDAQSIGQKRLLCEGGLCGLWILEDRFRSRFRFRKNQVSASGCTKRSYFAPVILSDPARTLSMGKRTAPRWRYTRSGRINI